MGLTWPRGTRIKDFRPEGPLLSAQAEKAWIRECLFDADPERVVQVSLGERPSQGRGSGA